MEIIGILEQEKDHLEKIIQVVRDGGRRYRAPYSTKERTVEDGLKGISENLTRVSEFGLENTDLTLLKEVYQYLGELIEVIDQRGHTLDTRVRTASMRRPGTLRAYLGKCGATLCALAKIDGCTTQARQYLPKARLQVDRYHQRCQEENLPQSIDL